jgi:hypothetical protein
MCLMEATSGPIATVDDLEAFSRQVMGFTAEQSHLADSRGWKWPSLMQPHAGALKQDDKLQTN